MLVSSIACFDVNSNLNSAVFASIKSTNPIMKVNSHTFNEVYKIDVDSRTNFDSLHNTGKNSNLEGKKLDLHC